MTYRSLHEPGDFKSAGVVSASLAGLDGVPGLGGGGQGSGLLAGLGRGREPPAALAGAVHVLATVEEPVEAGELDANGSLRAKKFKWSVSRFRVLKWRVRALPRFPKFIN